MDRFLARSLAIAVILAGVGAFYYYVIHLPAEERRQHAAETRASEITAQKQQQRAREYKMCMYRADQNYASGWATACKTFAAEQTRQLKNCLSTPSIVRNPLMGREWCEQHYGRIDSSAKCSLPGYQVALENKYRAEGEQKCELAAKMGLQ